MLIQRDSRDHSHKFLCSRPVSVYLMNTRFWKKYHVYMILQSYDGSLFHKLILILFSVSAACTLLLYLPIIGWLNTKYPSITWKKFNLSSWFFCRVLFFFLSVFRDYSMKTKTALWVRKSLSWLRVCVISSSHQKSRVCVFPWILSALWAPLAVQWTAKSDAASVWPNF